MAENLTFNLGVNNGQAVAQINEFFSAFDQGAAKAQAKLNSAFNQKLETEVIITMKGGQAIAKEVQAANSNAKKLSDTAKALNGQFAKTPTALKRQVALLKELQGNTKKWKDGTVVVTNEWKKVEEALKRAQRSLRTMSDGGGMGSFLSKLALVQTAANLATAGIMALGRSVGDFIGTAGRMEVLQLQLEAFTGGVNQANAAFEEFARIAAQTPFNLEQVANAGKILMAFGVETEQAIKSTDQLGIVAAATGGDINLLARNLGQIAAQGQAYTRDLTQFAIQGIPIWDEMSKVTGKSVAQLKAMAADGAIGFDLVKEALSNMTEEGSKFSQIAERMQETFAGRLAAIESSFQLLAKEAVASFNRLDQAMGGVVSGAMKNFAEAVKSLAENFDGFVGAILDVIPVLTAFGTAFAVINFATIKAAIVGVIAVLKTKALAIWAAVKAQYALLAAMGPKGWAIMAGAAVATGVAMAGVTGQIKAAMEEQKKLNGEVADGVEDTKAAAEAEKQKSDAIKETEAAARKAQTALELKAGAAKVAADAAKAAYDEEKEKLDALVASVKKKIDMEKEANSELIAGLRDRIAQEKEAYKSATAAVKSRYDTEIERARQVYDEKLRLMDLERDRLEARTPSEQKLYDLEKKELQAKINSGELDEKALLQAQARLERMERQEKLEKLSAERKIVEEQKAQKLKELEEQKTQELEEQKTKHESTVKTLESQVDVLEEQNDALDKQKKEIDNITSGTQAYNGELQDGITAIRQQAAETRQLEGAMRRAADEAARFKREMQAAKQAANEAQNAGGGGGGANRFAGGPVTGGTKYTVNELGKEAFLSASGKLSMINAPAWGQWKAPGAGTVIPAHLTKQLDIPTGGINVNGTARANGMSAGADGMGSMVRAIKGSLGGGDTISNNVTIQAINPTQAASDMMVNMNRVRRRRYT